MSFTVPPPPLDIAEHFPELLPHARSTTLLYPRSGAPDRRESSLGGPLLWPADEPWPTCSAPDHYNPGRGCAVVGPEAVAMVPVLQLFARDVPALVFPTGSDLLQVLWCPLIHSEHDQWSPVPVLCWRSVADVAPGPLLDEAPQPYEFDDEYVPRPCVVHPTDTTEYPNWDMPDDLSERVGEWSEELEEATGIDYWDAFTTRQSKVGGYPGWTQAPKWPRCVCGGQMEHLLTISASESCGRWLPVEERTRPGSGWEVPDTTQDDSHGMIMGDAGGVYVFVCRACPGWPTIHRYDC
ncbi:hypothetical protein ACFVYD_34700 [Streptomyces sp. NPDC058301]|uniref:hypothetical protein n=1 Tax=Streptomyces sp. NPDC058301 TaxID=3346436 RepID=UPI0036E19AD6